MGAQMLRKRTLWLPMCSAVAPMARGGTKDVPYNDTWQDITSSSTYTHVQGAYGAPTGAVGSAADSTRRGAEAP